jgi:hypothetical protein
MDGQRNDRLGRDRSPVSNVLENRREILRRCSGSDTHTNIVSEPNRDSYAHGHFNSHTDGNRDCHCNAYGYCNGNTHSYSETYTDPEGRSHTKIPAHARTAALGPIGMTQSVGARLTGDFTFNKWMRKSACEWAACSWGR